MKKPMLYIDRGRPGLLRYQRGGVLVMMEGKVSAVKVPQLSLEALRRRNSIDPELQPTLRMLLRWSENAGTGMPNPEADIRETHYDPLPPDLQGAVTDIVSGSPWEWFIRKLVSSTLSKGSLAEQLGMTRDKFCDERKNALWYFRGRFEAARIYA